MLGILLTESVEVIYSLAKITFDAGRGIYYWYYDEETPERKEIHKLEERIAELEKAADL